MWGFVRYSTLPGWVFLVFNSFIHTIMYTYYAMTTISAQHLLPRWFKKSLTGLQIAQFVVGSSVGYTYLFLKDSSGNDCLPTSGQKFSDILAVTYLAYLTYLFIAFFVASYKSHPNKKEKQSLLAKETEGEIGVTSGKEMNGNAGKVTARARGTRV